MQGLDRKEARGPGVRGEAIRDLLGRAKGICREGEARKDLLWRESREVALWSTLVKDSRAVG